MDDYTVKGVPADMTEEAFVRVLVEAGSPAASRSRVVWSYCVARQVSPAWLLAVFHHESGYGLHGTATETCSYGNTRRPSFGVPDIGIVAGRSGYFSAYANWADGGVSTVARICDYHHYYGNAYTVREITPIWAPSSDGNNTERYISAVLADIEAWTTQEPSMSAPKPPMTSKPSPNRGGYQHAHDPRCLVWHITQGTNSLGWLTNPTSGASSNYLIARTGAIYELVPPEVSAWANGRVVNPDLSNPVIAGAIREGRNLNTVSISIEHEGFTSQGRGGSLTAAQVDASVALSAWLCATKGIAPDRQHILGHFQVDSVDRPNCPGFSGAEWAAWVGRVAALVNPPASEGSVRTYLNEAGNAIIEINYGGQAVEVIGANLQDVGISVRNAAGEEFDRSVQANVFMPWSKR